MPSFTLASLELAGGGTSAVFASVLLVVLAGVLAAGLSLAPPPLLAHALRASASEAARARLRCIGRMWISPLEVASCVAAPGGSPAPVVRALGELLRRVRDPAAV